MADIIVILFWYGGARASRHLGAWRSLFWPYYAGRALAGLAFARLSPDTREG